MTTDRPVALVTGASSAVSLRPGASTSSSACSTGSPADLDPLAPRRGIDHELKGPHRDRIQTALDSRRAILRAEALHARSRVRMRVIDEVAYSLIKLSRVLERRLHRALDGQPIGASQLLALTHISRSPGLSRAALARKLAVSPQAAGMLTTQLHAAGLVDRTEWKPGRATNYTITPTGVRVLADTSAVAQVLLRDMAQRLSPGNLRGLAQLVRHLLSTLADGGLRRRWRPEVGRIPFRGFR